MSRSTVTTLRRTARRGRRWTAGLSVLGLCAVGLAALPPSPAEAALPPQCATSGTLVSCTFTGPAGSAFTLPVPNAVTSVHVHAVGGRGGGTNGALGGRPAVVDATLPTSDGDTFTILMRNDGGNPGAFGAGRGGGSSTVARAGGPVLVQAAGGGGAGVRTAPGGSAGGDAGSPGEDGTIISSFVDQPSRRGGAASPFAGGSGGIGGRAADCTGFNYIFGGNGLNGGPSFAGHGGSGNNGGGGGGGGRFGGGGGGGGATGCGNFSGVGGAGGGGGSNTLPAGATSGLSSIESALVRVSFTLRPRSAYTPSALAFGPREIGTTSATQPVTVTNTGSVPLSMGTATIGGPGAAGFAKGTDACSGTSLPVGASCQVAVRFAPATVQAFSATLSIPTGSPTSPHVTTLTGAGTPPADLKIQGIGSLYSGKDQLVTRTVPGPNKLMTYNLGIFNEDTLGRSYKLKLNTSGSPATAQVWTTGLGAKALLTDASGNFVTPLVGAKKILTLQLRVTPTALGQHDSRVDVDLLTDFGALIEGVDTETNTPAPAKGTSSYELTATQGGQPFIGGPVDDQTTSSPALNVGNVTSFTVRLKNDGTSPSSIGLKVSDVDGCAGSFTTAVKVGFTDRTSEAFAGTYVTPVRPVGQLTTVTVTVKRTGPGCAHHKLRVQSLNAGVPVRSSFLLTNAAYVAATD